jgi:hypothetical protein
LGKSNDSPPTAGISDQLSDDAVDQVDRLTIAEHQNQGIPCAFPGTSTVSGAYGNDLLTGVGEDTSSDNSLMRVENDTQESLLVDTSALENNSIIGIGVDKSPRMSEEFLSTDWAKIAEEGMKAISEAELARKANDGSTGLSLSDSLVRTVISDWLTVDNEEDIMNGLIHLNHLDKRNGGNYASSKVAFNLDIKNTISYPGSPVKGPLSYLPKGK